MNTEDRIRAAMDATLAAYDQLIADPKGERPKWENYGAPYACRLCVLMEGDCMHDGVDCPLLVCDTDSGEYISGCLSGDMRTSYRGLRFALDEAGPSRIVAAAIARRAALAAKFEAWNGARVGVL